MKSKNDSQKHYTKVSAQMPTPLYVKRSNIHAPQEKSH